MGGNATLAPVGKLALIAGTGGLPPVVAHAALAQGRVPVICEMRGFTSDVTGEFTRIPFRIETLGTLLDTLTALGITHICMAGAMQRPDVDPSAIDAATAPLIPRLLAAMGQGDDGTLRAFITLFEQAGFTVLAAHQIAPDLMPPAGVPTHASPPDLTPSIVAAQAALTEMAQVDQGQALIIKDGTVIAREDARGTAAMLHDLSRPAPGQASGGDPFSALADTVVDLVGGAADWLSAADAQVPTTTTGAFLYKAPKPGQNRLADMPLVGPDTARQTVNAGLAGIVIPAGDVMVLDLPQVVSILDRAGLFLWIMPKAGA